MIAEDFDDEEHADITDIHQEVENDVRSYHDENVAEEMPEKISSALAIDEEMPDSPTGNIAPQTMIAEDFDDEERTDIHQEVENDVRSYHDEEVAEARLKLILRIWRRHSSKKRQLREQRQLAANAALNSLSLDPPIRHRKDVSLFVPHLLSNI
ncbi:SAC3 family protein B-like [Cornus florida]|uniref:SAC3 family protein B-like n=1 Tax=Cornus florida TaxID=4283 RepID=UPI002898BC3B|nr:SAC3 family protein B-like [Cornus florida]